MQETGAVISGEGNGGVINPDLHPGRDALVGDCHGAAKCWQSETLRWELTRVPPLIFYPEIESGAGQRERR